MWIYKNLFKIEIIFYKILIFIEEKMNIYALELQTGKYYIGKTSRDVSARFEEHKRENGSEWTSVYKPVKIIEQYKSDRQFEEDTMTKKYMMRYGIENVRGGSYTKLELEEWQIKALQQEFKSVSDCCYKCGQKGHFADVCLFQGTDEELEEKIQELEDVKKYIVEIKPQQYLSIAGIERVINSQIYGSDLRNMCITILKHKIRCPKCNSLCNETMPSDWRGNGIACIKCNLTYDAKLKTPFKLTPEMYEKIPRGFVLINGILQDLRYCSNETTKITDEQYNIGIYKKYVDNAKFEKKYNKFVEKYNFCNDEEITKFIDTILVKLWQQMADRY